MAITSFIYYKCSLGCALCINTQKSTLNNQTKHVPSDAHFASTPNIQHPTLKQNMFPRMRTLHQHQTFNTQQPSKTCSLRCALCINSQHSTLNNQTKHVPSDTHFASTPNIQHPTLKQNMFPQMRTLPPLENYFHEKK